MFENFGEEAIRVVFYAKETAKKMGHEYVGTEHLLAGITLEKTNLAARYLWSLDIDAKDIEKKIKEFNIKSGEIDDVNIPLTENAKKVFEMADVEAKNYGCDKIYPVHLFLALTNEKSFKGSKILKYLTSSLYRSRMKIVGILNSKERYVAQKPSFFQRIKKIFKK